jgi:hypothetical protein
MMRKRGRKPKADKGEEMTDEEDKMIGDEEEEDMTGDGDR